MSAGSTERPEKSAGSTERFPFTAVVGQDDAKLALLLLAVDPLIGGVLLRGEKGSAKTTLARGLADLLSGDAPFVDLPLGATEDRLIGSLDLAKALTENDVTFTPGLLAAANNGVLYVDEVNLLADHLVDTLLDVSVSGINRVERDGVSHRHDARFVLIGSMNPEEGELRPQLLDRFGLSVHVAASTDPGERAQAVRRRLDFDQSGAGDELAPDDTAAQLQATLAAAVPGSVSDELIDQASRLALAVGAEGLRADIVLCRAAAANAGLDGRTEATTDDLRRVAPLVLAHRSRRNPFDPPVIPPQDLADAIDDTLDDPTEPPPDEPGKSDAPTSDSHDSDSHDSLPSDPGDADPAPGGNAPMVLGDDRRAPAASVAPRRPSNGSSAGRRVMAESDRGRLVRDVPVDPGATRPIAVAASVRRVAEKRVNDPDASVTGDDLRHAVKERKAGSLLILVVDTSGSMGASTRATLATGAAFGLLADAYERRDHVAVITVGGDGASIALAPTGSIEVARNRLSNLTVGGHTPLAEGLRAARDLARARSDSGRSPFVVLISDGRASGSEQASGASNAVDDAIAAASEVERAGIAGLVLDCETGVPRLGIAERIADAMAAPCINASHLGPENASVAIRTALAATGQ